MNNFRNCSLLLQRCLYNNDVPGGKSVHAVLIKTSLDLSVYLVNNVMNLYIKGGLTKDARKLFGEMPTRTLFSWNTLLAAHVDVGDIGAARLVLEEMPRRDSVSWTTIIAAYNRFGSYQESIEVFLQMLKDEVWPSKFTITNILSSCAATRAHLTGKHVHSFVLKLGFNGCVPVANSLLNMYSKVGDYATVKALYNRMILRDRASENIMISAHIRFGSVDLARAHFDQMTDRNMVAWNAMIAGYNQQDSEMKALQLFASMLQNPSLIPDRITLASVISACANLEMSVIGMQIHSYIIRSNSDSLGAVGNALISLYARVGNFKSAKSIAKGNNADIIALTSLLDGYLKVGKMASAREIFDSMENPDVVSYTAMIVGYGQNGCHLEAMELFKRMILNGPAPNSYTLAAMLSVVSSLAWLIHGKAIHAVAVKRWVSSHVSIVNSLINMYSKGGSVVVAKRVFESAGDRSDAATWTSLIMGLGAHGYGEEAIALYERMVRSGVEPDHITYVGLLTACSHVGMVEQGGVYMKEMVEVRKIKARRSHYGCMVDMYCRRGMMEEACRFIEEKMEKGEVEMWGSVLSACKLYKNAELAEVAAERLLGMEPGNAGAYASLASVYAREGRWEDAAQVRTAFDATRVSKDKGISWIR